MQGVVRPVHGAPSSLCEPRNAEAYARSLLDSDAVSWDRCTSVALHALADDDTLFATVPGELVAMGLAISETRAAEVCARASALAGAPRVALAERVTLRDGVVFERAGAGAPHAGAPRAERVVSSQVLAQPGAALVLSRAERVRPELLDVAQTPVHAEVCERATFQTGAAKVVVEYVRPADPGAPRGAPCFRASALFAQAPPQPGDLAAALQCLTGAPTEARRTARRRSPRRRARADERRRHHERRCAEFAAPGRAHDRPATP